MHGARAAGGCWLARAHRSIRCSRWQGEAGLSSSRSRGGGELAQRRRHPSTHALAARCRGAGALEAGPEPAGGDARGPGRRRPEAAGRSSGVGRTAAAAMGGGARGRREALQRRGIGGTWTRRIQCEEDTSGRPVWCSWTGSSGTRLGGEPGGDKVACR